MGPAARAPGPEHDEDNMSTKTQQQRSPWIVPIIVAIVGAIGVIGAAVLPGLLDRDNVTDPRSPTATTSEPSKSDAASTAPDIAGDYYLDEGNTRIIEVREVGSDTYSVTERLPADWPFTGEVSWDGQQFRGSATFASGVQMEISMEPVDDGRLKTAYAFTDSSRVDYHVLVPVFA